MAFAQWYDSYSCDSTSFIVMCGKVGGEEES